MVRVSACIIVRNEERMLPPCLESIRAVVDQVVVVDTGSTDGTKEIARGFGATVIDFAWVDSFAAARTESLRHATGDWVLWLDADERLDAVNRERLRRLLAGLGGENVGYFMRQQSPLADAPHATVHVDQVRLFPNHRGLAWRYRVHEQILPSLREFGADVRLTDIVIDHVGFAEPALQGPKIERNGRLLQLELQEHPDDTFVLYNVGAVAMTQGRLAEAIGYFQKCIDLGEPGDRLLAKVHGLITRCRHQEGRADLALAACRQGRAAFADDAELLFWEAVLLDERGDFAGTEASLRRLLALPRGICMTSADSGLQGYRGRQFLAELCAKQGRADEAAALARQVLAACPGHEPALRLLARQPTAPTAPRQRKSLCMIVKNEEENLPHCLASVAGVFDEVIVVDTGSTDRTRQIALAAGARVFDFPWIDSFAAARNECLRHATGEWIFWMDADDRLDAENRARLQALFAGLRDDNAGYVMTCRCLGDPVNRATTEVDHLRLFRNRADVRWDFRVHEQILPAVRDSGADVRRAAVVIEHTGYQDPAKRAGKLQRDLRLLLMENAERPEHPFILFNLGSIYQEQGRLAEAVAHLRRSLAAAQPDASIVRKLHALIAQCLNQQGEHAEALAACGRGRATFADDVELLFQEGLARRRLGDIHGAVRCWEQVLATPAGDYFASIHVGIRGYLTRHNLAWAYHDLQRFADAEAQWRLVTDERPDFGPAWAALGELLLARQRWPDVEELARRMEPHTSALAADVLRGRLRLARQEFGAAQQLFARLAEAHPTAIDPPVYLSHAYLQEGRDWDGAEKALHAVLALDPAHVQARNNLAVLRRQRTR